MGIFISLISLLFGLLFFHDAVISGTKNGLLLWYQTLIPALLPFILVTNALSETNAYQGLIKKLKKQPSCHVYELLAIILGNLCGYPIGGKIVSDFVNNNYLTPKQANRILSLCSQASPMFLLGYVYLHILNKQLPIFVFFSVIYIPVIMCYLFSLLLPENKNCIPFTLNTKSICINDTFSHTVTIMVNIGLYVIIFSILYDILLPLCQSNLYKIGLSMLEVTTGLKLANGLLISTPFKISIVCALSAFGGLCSAFQIKSVLSYPSSNIKKYLADKLLLSAGTFLLTYLYLMLKN